jgi:hypothetical protein
MSDTFPPASREVAGPVFNFDANTDPAGVVDCASAEVELFLRDDLKNLRPILLRRFWFFKPVKVRRNQ